MGNQQDIDALINWPDFFRQHIHTPLKPAGENKMSARCPFHDDHHESFWFTTTNGLWKCEACGAKGNGAVFLSRIANISTREAYKQLRVIAGVTMEKSKRHTPTYTLKEYALEKRLPIEYLQSLGLKDGYGNRYVEIPYKDESGKVIATRKRMPKGSKKRFVWNKGDKSTLYGRWRMQEIRDAGYVILVEGESDAQTLWMLGLPALGFPGASNFNEASARLILDIPEIYLHIEPDLGGRTAKKSVSRGLLGTEYKGVVKQWSCVVHDGLKDPSAVFIAEDSRASEIIRGIMTAAVPMNLEKAALGELKGLEDAPVKIRVPDGYELDDKGIHEIDPRTGIVNEVPFCWTPILIMRQLRDIATDERKVEYTFKDHTGWVKGVVPRDMLATARSVTKLSAFGADVTSENAAQVVRWFSALERANGDMIENQKCVSQYGWIGDRHFTPCLMGDEYHFDRGSWGRYANVGNTSGTLDAWIEAMRAARKNSIFRFILAASFAAPLLKIVRERIFVVYNWSDSRGGKTAALYAALSAWGDPLDLISSFNTTTVFMERLSGLFSDLPLGLNERQLAGGGSRQQDFLDRLIYQLAEGSSKGRGAREGGIQTQVTWRNIVIANGEEPLTGQASQSGTNTRALEIFGSPFDDEDAASRMYTVTAQHHGHAGAAYIEQLAGADKNKLREARDRIISDLRDRLNTKQRHHITYMATVCLADLLIEQWLFGGDADAAYDVAMAMAKDVFKAMETDADAVDVNRRAYEYLCGWVAANRGQFTDDYTGTTRYGYIDKGDAEHVIVFPAILDEALQRGGFSAKKTRKWMAANGKVDTTAEAGGRVRDTIQRRIGATRMRMIRLLIDEDFTPEQIGFTEVDDPDMPF